LVVVLLYNLMAISYSFIPENIALLFKDGLDILEQMF